MTRSSSSQVSDEFAQLFPGAEATILVTAPGRVNLIGEHTDYNGYPVLPMALRRAIRIALAPRDDSQVVVRSPVAAHGERSFSLAPPIEAWAPGDWANYIKAAAQTLIEHDGEDAGWRGFDAVVSGDVPSGAGLSSSSALVVASGLALLAANERAMPGEEFADLMASAEHYVGTAGGGMDQAACVQAREHHALRIDFFPLRTDPVPMPEGVTVIVANSLVVAEKSGAARLKYNRRPLECRLATKLLAKRHGRDPADVARLAQTDPAPAAYDELHDGGYTKREIADELGMTVEELDAGPLTLPDGSLFPEPEDGFRLRERVRHVLTEAARVDAATVALRSGDIVELGRLMNDSHASCRGDYGISTPELDRLVAIMLDAGALGARLTGAGFGGCAVALARRADAAAIMSAVRKRYYAQDRGLTDSPPAKFGGWNDVLFSTDAGPGATVTPV